MWSCDHHKKGRSIIAITVIPLPAPHPQVTRSKRHKLATSSYFTVIYAAHSGRNMNLRAAIITKAFKIPLYHHPLQSFCNYLIDCPTDQ